MIHRSLFRILCACFIVAFIINLVGFQRVQGAGIFKQSQRIPMALTEPEPPSPLSPFRYSYNSNTGKLNFISGDSASPLYSPAGRVTAASLESAGKAVISRYASDFGLRAPSQELKLASTHREERGTVLRYQQQYRGIPVLGGELLVNIDRQGNVLSLNGEVSPELSLPGITPKILENEAGQAALIWASSWFTIAVEELSASKPELWIYDERLLKDSDQGPHLVWRTEVTSKALERGINELVLVDANSGEIGNHFSQVKTAGEISQNQGGVSKAMPETGIQQREPGMESSPIIEPPMVAEKPAPTQPSEELSSAPTDSQLNATTWYISETGSDESNCLSPATACKTLGYVVGLAGEGADIRIQAGTYGESNVNLEYSTKISGGWNAGFTTQNGRSSFYTPSNSGMLYFLWIKAAGTEVNGLDLSNYREIAITVTESGAATIQNIGFISNGTGLANFGTATVSNVYFINNATAVSNASGTINITNMTALENMRGVHNSSTGTATVSNLTFTNSFKEVFYKNNDAIYNEGSFILRNSIVTGTTRICRSGNGTLESKGFNILQSACTSSGSGIFIADSTDQIGVDPGFGPEIIFRNQKYLPLAANSPAINAILPSDPDYFCPATDQRGVTRPQGVVCDIGAYEYAAPGAPSQFVVYSGTYQTAALGRKFLLPLVLQLLDASGTGIPGASITLTAPSSGASGVFADTNNRISNYTTDAFGFIRAAAFRANLISGSYNLHVAVAGSSVTTDIALVNNEPSLHVDGANGDDGENGSNDCRSAVTPCKTLNNAYVHAVNGDLVKVAAGIYSTGNFGLFGDIYSRIKTNLTFSGGWNSTFTEQIGRSDFVQNSGVLIMSIQKNTWIGLDQINMYATAGQILLSNAGYLFITHGLIGAVPGTNQGSGIASSGTLEVSDVEINTVNATGLYNTGTAVVQNAVIHGNQMGVDNHGAITINDTDFYDNFGLLGSTGNLNISHVTIHDNHGGVNNSGQAIVSGLSIYHNEGGFYNSGTLEMSNSTISRNTNNGVVYSYHLTMAFENAKGTATLKNVTITDNFLFSSYMTAGNHFILGGIYNSNGTVNLVNTIVAGNRGNSGGDCGGNITSLGHNLIGTNEGCNFSALPSDFVGTAKNPIDPFVAEAADNGGNTKTVALLEGSPAIDHGDPGVCPATDQRGNNRPQGTACDIGAYEGSISGETLPHVLTFLYYPDIYTFQLPGLLLCQTPTTDCTSGSDLDADAAHKFTLGMYDFYKEHFQRKSLDNADFPLVSTVHVKNASNTWTGSQAYYGDFNPQADDIVGLILSFGLNDYTSNLFYYYQSGAISVSYADLWGEFFDQANGWGNDSEEVKWLIGEDLPNGPYRSMSNPAAFKDPDRMLSLYYYKGPNDYGGVHKNNGVNNKAAYLMISGGSFNNKKVSQIGWQKTAAIYYYTQTHFLTSGSDYADLYVGLQQACSILTGGPEGITADDCQQVKNALDAVQMNLSPNASYNPDAPECPTGYDRNPTNLFYDGLEDGAENWSFGATVGNPRWSRIPGANGFAYAASGQYALFGNNYDPTSGGEEQTSDSYAAFANGVRIPPGDPVFLHFNHAFGFEYYIRGTTYYFFDGGMLEYSVDDGATWKDMKSLFSAGRNYSGVLFNAVYAGRNPLHGRLAFVADSHGYVSTRYNLSSLSGKTIKLRFRIGTDYSGANFGWAVDDVTIYTCVGKPGVPPLISPLNGSLSTNYQPKLDWGNAANANHYEAQIATDAGFSSIAAEDSNLPLSEFTPASPLADNTRYYWRVRAINTLGAASIWSAVWTFRTGLLPPVLSAPVKSEVLKTLRPAFQWSVSPGAVSYTLVVSAYPNLASPVLSKVVSPNSYLPITDLPMGRTLYWRVKANGANPSAWSERFSFSTPRPPSVPVLVTPTANQLLTNYTPTLTWRTVTVPPGALAFSYYRIQLDDQADFLTPLYDLTGLKEANFAIPAPLAPNQKYFWRVQACNLQDECSWWRASYFRAAVLPPLLLTPIPEEILADTTPDFDWSDVDGATNYSLVVSPNSNFALPLLSVTSTASAYTSPKVLPKGKTLYWRVRANGPNGPSLWSEGYTFKIQ